MVSWLPVLLSGDLTPSDSWSLPRSRFSLWKCWNFSSPPVFWFYRMLVYIYWHPLCWAWSGLFPSDDFYATNLRNLPVTSYLSFSSPLFLGLLSVYWIIWKGCPIFFVSSPHFLILYILVLLSERFLQVYFLFYFSFKFLTLSFGYSLNNFWSILLFSSWI